MEFGMIEKYFLSGVAAQAPTDEQHKRLVALEAALEIAKASASAPGANGRTDKVEQDLKYSAKEIHNLANSIRAYLDK
jgi:hypothetical protein